jgi:hypothetical protein
MTQQQALQYYQATCGQLRLQLQALCTAVQDALLAEPPEHPLSLEARCLAQTLREALDVLAADSQGTEEEAAAQRSWEVEALADLFADALVLQLDGQRRHRHALRPSRGEIRAGLARWEAHVRQSQGGG